MAYISRTNRPLRSTYLVSMFLITVMSYWPISIYANQTDKSEIVFAVNTIDGLLEEGSETMAYSRVLNLIKQRSKYNIAFKHNPATRAMKLLETREALCLFPSSLALKQHQNNKVGSLPINTAKAYFMALKKISTERMLRTDLPPLKLGYWRGNTYGGKIEQLSHHILVDADTDIQAARLIERERIDVMLAYIPDSLNLIYANPEKPWLFDQNSHFYTQDDSFVCHDTPLARALIDDMNQIITSMKTSGELKSILGENYIE